jgi:hypothetical protein
LGANIKNPETEADICEMAALNGETLTEATIDLVRERCRKLQAKLSGRCEAPAPVQSRLSRPLGLRTSRHYDFHEKYRLPV